MPLDDSAELGRLAALRRSGVLDTPPGGAFDRITGLAAKIMDTPISVISFVDNNRVWYRSVVGPMPERVAARVPGFCDTVVTRQDMHVVENAFADPETRNHPLVLGKPEVAFYAGVPLLGGDGHVLGALACMDTKPRNFDRGGMAELEALAAIAMDQTELRRSAAQVSRLSEALAASCQDMERRAGYDPLTGVLARDAMLERSIRLVSRARSGMTGAAVLLMDVDRLTLINDTFGQVIGDRVLREVANRLVQRCRGNDLVGRIGGDQFLAVFSDVSFAQSLAIAARLREAVCGGSISLPHGTVPLEVSVSGGLFFVPASDAPFTLSDAILEVEDALRRAKANGRNHIVLAHRTADPGI